MWEEGEGGSGRYTSCIIHIIEPTVAQAHAQSRRTSTSVLYCDGDNEPACHHAPLLEREEEKRRREGETNRAALERMMAERDRDTLPLPCLPRCSRALLAQQQNMHTHSFAEEGIHTHKTKKKTKETSNTEDKAGK